MELTRRQLIRHAASVAAIPAFGLSSSTLLAQGTGFLDSRGYRLAVEESRRLARDLANGLVKGEHFRRYASHLRLQQAIGLPEALNRAIAEAITADGRNALLSREAHVEHVQSELQAYGLQPGLPLKPFATPPLEQRSLALDLMLDLPALQASFTTGAERMDALASLRDKQIVDSRAGGALVMPVAADVIACQGVLFYDLFWSTVITFSCDPAVVISTWGAWCDIALVGWFSIVILEWTMGC
ncbi:MAG: hypothetical protein U0163_00160 [Gemmatimonadaceae bacterium]